MEKEQNKLYFNKTFEEVTSEDYILSEAYNKIEYLQPLAYNDEKIILTEQLSDIFRCSHTKIMNRFYRIKNTFTYGKDYYMLSNNEIQKYSKILCARNGSIKYFTRAYCWTQNGVLLLLDVMAYNDEEKHLKDRYKKIYQYLKEKYFDINFEDSSICKYNIIGNSVNNTVIDSIKELKVKEVDLFGDTVIAAQDENGVIWAGVRWFCDGLGLSEGQVKRQITNIGQDIVLGKGVANLLLPTKGGKQDVLCLQLDYIPLWLAKISITPNMKKTNPELVDKLIKYQLNAKDVLGAAFLPELINSIYNNFNHNTSSTPIPKVKDALNTRRSPKSHDWFYNNYNKIEWILDAFGWERSYLYHIILKTIGQKYDLQAAEKIYKNEFGVSAEYAMDIIEYFDELADEATKILNKFINGIIDIN